MKFHYIEGGKKKGLPPSQIQRNHFLRRKERVNFAEKKEEKESRILSFQERDLDYRESKRNALRRGEEKRGKGAFICGRVQLGKGGGKG